MRIINKFNRVYNKFILIKKIFKQNKVYIL